MDANSSEVHPLFPKPVSIAKVIAPMTYKRAIVRAIEEMGQVEPIRVDPRTGSDDMEVEERRNQIEAFQSSIRSYLKVLNPYEISSTGMVQIGQTEDDVINYLHDIVNKKGARIGEIITRKEEISERLSQLQSIMELLEKLDNLNINDTSMLKDTRHVKTFMGTVFPAQMQRLYWEIEEITDNRYLMIENKVDKENTLLALSVLKSDSDAVSDRLKTFSFSDVVIPQDLDLDGLTQTDCLNEMASLEQEIVDLDLELEQLASQVGTDLLAAREIAEIELQRISIEMKMRRTKSTCVLWAWLPEELQEEFKTKVHGATEGAATFDFRRGDFDPDITPSRVENSEFMNPMRGLVTSFGTPGLHEIDPYKFVAFLFPVLFGIMFADLGHGILLFLAGLVFRQKKKKLKEEPKGIAGYAYGGANLMIIMGLTSAFMGILMNSVFGDETLLWQIPFLANTLGETTWQFFFHYEQDHGHIVIERNYVNLLLFSFAVGAIVILLGLILNLYQLYYYKHSDADWYAGLGLFGAYFFVILTVIVGALTDFNEIVIGTGVALIIGSIVATLTIEFRAHGIDGLMLGVDHVLALMSNTFSFGRLLAMNTVHFVLAVLPFIFIDIIGASAGIHVFNHYIDQWIDPSQFGWWLLGAVIGSLIVVPVETTFSTLQALRLNWVEFFGKFYKGTGVEFKPVKVDRTYSEEM